MSFGQTIQIQNESFELLELGKYIAANSTNDEPQYFEIQSTVNPDKESSFVLKRTSHKNNPNVGSPDLKASVHMVIRFQRGFSRSEIDTLLVDLMSFASGPNITKVLRGER